MLAVAAVAAALSAVVEGVFVDTTSLLVKNTMPEIGEVYDELNNLDVTSSGEERLAELEEQIANLEASLDAQDDVSRDLFLSVLPAIVLMELAIFVVGSLAALCYLGFASSSAPSHRVASLALRRLPAFMVMALLVLLVSCVWLVVFVDVSALAALLGLLISLVLVPRLALGPVFVMRDGLGPIRSIKRSLTETRGKWLASLGLLVALFIAVALAVFVGIFLALFLGGLASSLYLLLFLQKTVAHLGLAAVMSGLVALEATLAPSAQGHQTAADVVA